MPGQVLTSSSQVTCPHVGGQAKAPAPSARVTVAGSPAITMPGPWMVTGCPNPAVSGGPCATAVWTSAAVRVTSMGQPLLVSTGTSNCAPTPGPLLPVVVQPRVRAS